MASGPLNEPRVERDTGAGIKGGGRVHVRVTELR
jgi:hypothetical protein